MPSFVAEEIRASQLNQAKMPHVGHFSNRFREVVRGSNDELSRKGFASGQADLFYQVKCVMAASCMDHVFDSPTKVINYVECHDNHTLWDKNRVCCHGESRDLRENDRSWPMRWYYLHKGFHLFIVVKSLVALNKV